MAIADLSQMTLGEIEEYVEKLENQIQTQTRKLDNQKKLSTFEVKTIRRLAEDGRTYAEIGDIFDIHRSNVGRIVKRVYYKDVA